MKTILLATDHVPLDPAALDYARVLCRRLAAWLAVLQILPSPSTAEVRPRPCVDADQTPAPRHAVQRKKIPCPGWPSRWCS